MTILVGILAKDGAVIATDRAVTFGLGGVKLHTVGDSHKKMDIVDSRVIVAGTGQVGMGQRFLHEVRKASRDLKLFSKKTPPVEIASTLCELARKEFARTGADKGTFGALIAVAEPLMLVEYQVADFQPELKTDQLCYVSMGSGQILADPYLALLKRVIWPNGSPSIEDAILGAIWTIKTSIKVAPGMIAEPIDVAVIRKNDKNDMVARLLSGEQLEGHFEKYALVNQRLSEAFSEEQRDVETAPSIPSPESPSEK